MLTFLSIFKSFFSFIFRPQYGGKTCKGDDKIFKMCNVQVCCDLLHRALSLALLSADIV